MIFPSSENIHVEFKTSFNHDVIETLVAFSNAKGGTVYIGVSDNGEVKGISIEKETIQNWINEIKNKTTPQIIPDYEVLEKENKTVVVLVISEYPIKPVSTRGRYYKRVGNSNHLLSATEVANMHLQTVNSSWDYYPNSSKTLNDISLEKVSKVMNIIKQRTLNFDFDSPLEFLSKNEMLLSDNRISNGCYLMFCKEDSLFTTVQMGHFASEIVIKDDVVDSGDILNQVEAVMSFVRKHINKELIITDKKIENIQRWQYPLDGIRELVLNMIIHRDYTASPDSIVKVFPDHILFFNPGSLPDSITIEQLLASTYVSTPRNRQIAKTVKEMGLIERYGTGIKRVRRMFLEYGLPEPTFETIPGGFAVTVCRKSANLVTETNIDTEESDAIDGAIGGAIDNQTGGQTGGQTSGQTGGQTSDYVLTAAQLSVLNIIKGNCRASRKVIADSLNISPSAVQKHIIKLKNNNIIKRVGGDFGGYWLVNDK